MTADPRSRRELTVVALLTAAGAVLAVVAGGRIWATVRAPDALTPVAPALTGADLAGAASALGWAALAGVAALFATRGRVRSVLGGMFVLLGAGIMQTSVTALGHREAVEAAIAKAPLLRLAQHVTVHPTAWWTISAAGGVLLIVTGLVTIVRGARWPGMSARYDPAGATRASASPATGASPGRDDASGLWKSIDRGEDPTAIEHKEH